MPGTATGRIGTPPGEGLERPGDGAELDARPAEDLADGRIEGFFGRRRDPLHQSCTFVNSFVLPIIGYFERAELVSDRDRKSYDLPPKERMAKRPKSNGQCVLHSYSRTGWQSLELTAD